jgi:N-acyl-D-amino-acid deacylase
MGTAAYFADVGIRRGKIEAVRRGLPAGKAEVDAGGHLVTPGFIDVHTHSESLPTMPEAENFIRMGVTSIVTGNCGGSSTDVNDFYRSLERARAAVNVATLVGHNSVRRAAMGGDFNREPTLEELGKMKELVDRAMREGAVGLSTGLIYLPGTFAKPEEVIELAKAIAPYDGIYVSHMRNEGAKMKDALEEVFRVARGAGVRAHVSHIKRTGKPNWGTASEHVALIDRARSEGIDITQDQYAYTASSTGIGANLIPSWAREGGREKYIQRIADSATKARIVAEMKQELKDDQRQDYSWAVIASYRHDPSLNGKSVLEATRLRRGSDSVDEQIELILETERNGGAGGVFHEMREDDLLAFLRHPNTMIASDSGPRRKGPDFPHPRGYGNNARLLGRYARDMEVMRLEEAVRRMTSLPARVFRLRDRGIIREGAWADLVVLDPARIRDTATFEAPHQFPEGIRAVVVNGQVVLRDGNMTKARPGQPLRGMDQ